MKTLKIGMIGLDTSHCQSFAGKINHREDEFHVEGGQVVKAFPGGSKLFSSSFSRVDGITAEMRDKFGVEIVDSIDQAADGMDAFLLESVDGRQHLEQFKILAKYGRPVFIDKPLACCFKDAEAICRLAVAKKVPLFTASAIRYGYGVAGLVPVGEKVTTCDTFGPMAILDDYPDYFWYGIHLTDSLFSYMGRGCDAVRTVTTKDFDLITGIWDDGRIGTVKGMRTGYNTFGCITGTVKDMKIGIHSTEIPHSFLLLKRIMEFFHTGKAPIDPAESLEVIAFLDAASKSRAAGGKEVKLQK